VAAAVRVTRTASDLLLVLPDGATLTLAGWYLAAEARLAGIASAANGYVELRYWTLLAANEGVWRAMA